jgi:hypothetical protein
VNDVVFIEYDGQGIAGCVQTSGEPTYCRNEGGGPLLPPGVGIFLNLGVIFPEIHFCRFANQGSDIVLGGFADLDFRNSAGIGDLFVPGRGTTAQKAKTEN